MLYTASRPKAISQARKVISLPFLSVDSWQVTVHKYKVSDGVLNLSKINFTRTVKSYQQAKAARTKAVAAVALEIIGVSPDFASFIVRNIGVEKLQERTIEGIVDAALLYVDECFVRMLKQQPFEMPGASLKRAMYDHLAVA